MYFLFECIYNYQMQFFKQNIWNWIVSCNIVFIKFYLKYYNNLFS